MRLGAQQLEPGAVGVGDGETHRHQGRSIHGRDVPASSPCALESCTSPGAVPLAKSPPAAAFASDPKIALRLGATGGAFYTDEVDIDLNPRIGPDWMLPGQQRWVLTPGTNVKRFLAGALNRRTGHLVWVEGDQKLSWLFLNLLRALLRSYRRARVLHLILDNYIIHWSRIVKAALAQWGGRIRMHFLPPYCPDENRIEHLWLQLHVNVTRNHRCRSIRELLAKVRRFLRNATPFPGSQPSLARVVSP